MQLCSAGSILWAVGLISLSARLCGQVPAPASSAPAADRSFASEPYVIQSSSTVTSMNADGTGTRLETCVVSIQSESALHDLGVLTLVYSSQSERAEFVYARVVHPDGSTQATPVEGAMEQPAPITQQAPFYSDLETKQLPVKSMRVGDRLEWQARITGYRAEVPGQFWGQDTFSSGAVILDESYELRVPAGIHLTVWTNPRAGAIFSEADAAGQHIYRWRHSDLHPTVGAEAEAAKKAENLRMRTPDEELDLVQGKLPSFAWTTFADWAAVGAWYRALVADRLTPDDAIKAKVAELTSGKATDLERAQAVYTFVSTRIRYVGVDFGVGRYQPHTAAEVFANQYGDCKDKHVLLASMLSVLGLHADPVLVGVNIRFNSAVPSPASFNHVITRLSLDGKEVWLDATAEVGTWGALLKGVRDQDALAIPATAAAVVVHTPVELPYAQTAAATLVGALDKDLTSESTYTFVLHDDDELALRSILQSVSPAQYDTFIQAMMSGMGFGGTTTQPEIDHLDDPSQPLQLSFHYRRVKEKDWGDNRITAAFQPIALPYFTTDQPATSAILLGSPRTETSTVTLKLPEGWGAQLPDAVHAHADFATCDVTYSLKEHTLVAERRLVVLKSKVPVKDYKLYQAWYDESGASGVPFIQLFPAPKVTAGATLSEPNAPTAPAAGAGVKPSDPKAADLIQQAQQSARSMDLDTARKDLDQANQINPTEPHLWSTYAGVASLLGMSHQALEDMQRELTYHPEEVQYYPIVAQAELARDPQDVLSTLRAWVKAAPDSGEAALALARRLMDVKQFSEALNEAHTAMDTLTATGIDVTDLKIVAASAQVALGRAGEAADSVAPLLKTATDPARINDIAYVLAEGNVDLDEAAAAQAKLLDGAEADTAAWSISGDLKPLLQQQARIAAEWDTMAWILYRQGKFAEAYGYEDAALHDNDIKDHRDHLAAISARLHSPAAAATVRADEQKLRTFALGSANGRQGVIFVTLLLADGRVIDSTSEKTASPGSPLTDPGQYLKKADLKALFPPGSKAHLIRTGFVNCHSGVCELILSPFDGVQVVPFGASGTKIGPTVKSLPLAH